MEKKTKKVKSAKSVKPVKSTKSTKSTKVVKTTKKELTAKDRKKVSSGKKVIGKTSVYSPGSPSFMGVYPSAIPIGANMHFESKAEAIRFFMAEGCSREVARSLAGKLACVNAN